MSRHLDSAPETPADAPAVPRWRARLLTSMPDPGEPGEEGPKRLTRHERVSEEHDQRGR